jgi:hypothetical protein
MIFFRFLHESDYRVSKIRSAFSAAVARRHAGGWGFAGRAFGLRPAAGQSLGCMLCLRLIISPGNVSAMSREYVSKFLDALLIGGC